jgi:hypothetical protein
LAAALPTTTTTTTTAAATTTTTTNNNNSICMTKNLCNKRISFTVFSEIGGGGPSI